MAQRRLLGDAYIAIHPDDTGFRAETKAAVEKALKGMQAQVRLQMNSEDLAVKARAAVEKASKAAGDINIKTNLDTKGLAAQSAAIMAAQSRIAQARASDEKAAEKELTTRSKMYASMFDQISKGEASLAKAEASAAAASKASVDRIAKARQADYVNQQKGIADTHKMLSGLFDEAEKRRIKLGIDAASIDPQLAALRGKLDALTFKTFNVRVSAKGDEAEAEAVGIRERLKAILGGITVKVKAQKDDFSFSSIVSFIAGKFTRDVEDAAGNAGDGAGQSLVSRFGGFIKGNLNQSTGIAALIVAGLGALPAAVGAVGAVAGVALGAGLIFAAEKLLKKQIKVLNVQLKKDLTAAKGTPAGSGANQAVASDQAQIAALNKQLGAFRKVNDAVTRLKQTFIQFAIIASKPLIAPFARALNDLSNELKGPLTKAFILLFKAVGPLVSPVLSALLEIVEFALPGLTLMLKKARGPLTELIAGFGRVVGMKLGQWFQDAIPFIRQSSHYLLSLLGLLGDIGSALIKFGGGVATAFQNPDIQGFFTSIGKIAGALLTVIIPAFEGWAIVMTPVAQALAAIVVPLATFLANNPALVKALGALYAGFKLLMIVKALRAAMLALAAAEGTAAITSEILALAVSAIPFVALAAAIALAVVLIIKYWGPISGFFVRTWKQIWSGAIGPMINFFTHTIPHAFGVTLNWVKKNWPLLVGLLLAPATLGMSLVFGVVVKYHNQILKFISRIWGHIENTITGILKPIASVMEAIWNGIYGVIKSIWSKIYAVIRLYVLISVGIIGEAWRGIKNLTGLIWPYIFSYLKTVWGRIENAATGVFKPIASIVVGAWNLIKNTTAATWNWIFRFAKSIWGHIENAVTGVVKPLASITSGQFHAMSASAQREWNWIFTFSKSVWGHIENTVTGIVKPMVSGINTAWKNLGVWTSAAFKLIYKYIFDPLNKAQTWIANTFVGGVKSAFSGLVSTVSSIWDGLKKVVAEPINFVIQKVWNPFAHFVDAGLSIFGIKSQLNDHVDTVKFARGGHVPGYSPGSDTVPAMLSPGEYVLNPTATRAIGVRNLDAINSSVKAGGGQSTMKGAGQAFANGGDVVNDITKWNGHRYVWGGGANPGSGWDCSSFVNWIVGHDFKLNLPGGASWAQTTNNGQSHGPVVSGYENWNYGRHVPWSDAKRGDLALENGDGHIGFVIQDNTGHSNTSSLQGFAARSTATGTGYQQYSPQDFHLVRFADDRGLVSQAWDNTGGAVLKAAAELALNGISGLANGALNKIPGTGPFKELPKAVINKVISAAKSKLEGKQDNFQFTDTSFGPDSPGLKGTGPATPVGPVGAGVLGFANALLKALGDPSNQNNRELIAAWATQEGGVGHNNPLNTTQSEPGAGTFNSVGVKTYPSMAVGVEATVTTLKNGLYGGILSALASGKDSLSAFESTVSNSPWGTKFATGGHVPGYAPGSDTVPARLSPGEYVLNPTATRAIGVRNLDSINYGIKPGSPQKFAKGGQVRTQAAKNHVVNSFGQLDPHMPEWARYTTTQLKIRVHDEQIAAQHYLNQMKADTATGKSAQYLKDSSLFIRDNSILTGSKHALARRAAFDKEPASRQALDIAGADKGIAGFYAQQQAAAFAKVTSLGKEIARLNKVKKRTAAQNKALATDKSLHTMALADYMHDGQLSSHWNSLYNTRLAQSGTDTANAKKAAQVKAAQARAAQVAVARAQAANEAKIVSLGANHPHAWLEAQAAKLRKRMNAEAAKGQYAAYASTASTYNDVEAAISRWPTQLNAQHDRIVSQRNQAQGFANSYLAKHDLPGYAKWNQRVLADDAKIAAIDKKLAIPAGVNPASMDPVTKLTALLGGADKGLFSAVSYQLKNHSLNPAPTGKLSHADMTKLAMHVTPGVLDALYAQDTGALNIALKDVNTKDWQGDTSATSLKLLGKLTGQHGVYAGVRFAQGGLLPSGLQMGVDLKSGMTYSMNEGGRRERVITDAQSQQYNGSQQMQASLDRQNDLLEKQNMLLAMIADSSRNSAKTLGSVGRGAL